VYDKWTSAILLSLFSRIVAVGFAWVGRLCTCVVGIEINIFVALLYQRERERGTREREERVV